MNLTQNEQFTLAQLETLARAWEECRLSRAEESMLRRVLAQSRLHSPVLDGCRTAMGAEIAARRTGRRRHSPRIWAVAAASLALVAALSPLVYRDSSPQVTVYVAGRETSDRHSREIAVEQMHSTLARMDAMLADSRRAVDGAVAATNHAQAFASQTKNLQYR